MSQYDRRRFLKIVGAGAAASMFPPNIARALEIQANSRTGTIKDVEHIVILTQENRSFDHYFGAMKGVRGFGDPRAVKLPSGKPVWFQRNKEGTNDVVPFRPDVPNLGATFLPDPPHGWNDTHAAWNHGNHDQWVPNKGVTAMTYHGRGDLSYHYALAEAFTVCDAYHCSLMGPTDPNRYHLWTGWCGNDGQGGGPVITNAEAGYDWTTYPERLEKAGISWKVYQDIGDGLFAQDNPPVWWGWTEDAFIGNYGDNSLLYFHQYQNAKPGEALYDKARTGTEVKAKAHDPLSLLEDFRVDVLSGNLPQVSYIAAPEAYSEHPNFPADYGAWYISQVIDALIANPEVWSKTVLFINYDEEGGFFDHTVPPTPPMDSSHGASTVSTVNEIFPGVPGKVKAPYGLGMRVPMIIVSPWTKGGWVNSQVFDHTSLIRFIEARFADGNPDLIEANITPWRRAVAGDLTSAFDFSKPSNRRVALPNVDAFMPTDYNRAPDEVPTEPATPNMPQQETGVRLARALPYCLEAKGTALAAAGEFRIDFDNLGAATAVYHVRSGKAGETPRSYTVEPGKHLAGKWSFASNYDLAVYGPNGFFRAFKGSLGGGHAANLKVEAVYDTVTGGITLNFVNLGGLAKKVHIRNKYSGKSIRIELEPGAAAGKFWSLRRQFGWYDFVITVSHDATFEYQYAGHVENGKPSSTDPAMGGML